MANKALFILFLISSHFCFSQASVTRTVSANVFVNSYLAYDVNTNGFIDFKFNDNQQLLDGITLPNKFSVVVASNKNWVLNVSSLTSKFLALGPDASTEMSPSILGIKKSNTTNFVPISNNPSSVAVGYKGNQSTAGNQFTLDIKATPGFEFNGGAYMLVLIFTMSPQ